MRTKRRWLSLLLVLVLVLAACGGGDEGGEETTTTTAAETTTTAGGGGEETTTTTMGEEPMEIATDVGVDLEAGTITVGLLSDLTGPFGPLVTAIVAGHQVYWQHVNDNGGIHGLQVELEVVDTQYIVDNHIQLYEELKDEVVAFGHSTGSPHTVAINPQLQEDGILAIPLTWYSGWSDPAINSNLVPHGAPYCIEAMDMIEYLMKQAQASGIEAPKLAIVSMPGDYGLDSAVGAQKAAEALGLEVVYDGSGTLIPGDESTLTAAAESIASSGADIVWATATPGLFSSVYGQTIARGFVGIWGGAGPSWNPAYVAEGSPIADAITRDMYISFYADSWNGDSAGVAEVRDLFAQYQPDAPPTDYYGEGFVEAKILHEALLKAYDNGDLTQSGVVAAAKSLEEVDFDGLAPNETYVGGPNERLQRKINIFRPDPTAPTGSVKIESEYVSDTAANYDFEEACYKL